MRLLWIVLGVVMVLCSYGVVASGNSYSWVQPDYCYAGICKGSILILGNLTVWGDYVNITVQDVNVTGNITADYVFANTAIGIGTTTPNGKFQVDGASGSVGTVNALMTLRDTTSNIGFQMGATTDYGWIRSVDVLVSHLTYGVLKLGNNFVSLGDGNNNDQLYLDTVNERLGIGTTNPLGKLHIVDTSNSLPRGIVLDEYYNGVHSPVFMQRKSRGTPASPAAVEAGDGLSFLNSYPRRATGFATSATGLVGIYASEDHTDAASGSYIVFKTTDEGTTTADERMRILHNGNVGINTSAPQATLHVNGTGVFEDDITIDAELIAEEVNIEDKVEHVGDTNTYLLLSTDSIELYAGGETMIDCNEAASDECFIGDASSAVDLIVYDGGLCVDNAGDCGGTTNDGWVETDTLDTDTGYIDTAYTDNTYVDNKIIYSDGALAIADDLIPAQAAAANLDPTTTFYTIDCQDGDGCDITLQELNALHGTIIHLICMSANACNFADTAGVSELAGAYAMGQYDSLSIMYSTDRYIEISRSNN